MALAGPLLEEKELESGFAIGGVMVEVGVVLELLSSEEEEEPPKKPPSAMVGVQARGWSDVVTGVRSSKGLL